MEDDLPKRVMFNWKKALCYALPVIIVLSAVTITVGARKGRAETDFVAASHAFLKWEKILEKGGEDFLSLQKLIKKHPELQAYYDAQIGQNFLALRDSEEAGPYVDRTLMRTKQPYYSDYALTSLKVSGREYVEALREARKLKKKLLKDETFWENRADDSSLFAFNLMRIATLCEELGDEKGELEAWREIKQYGGWLEGAPIDEKIGQAGFKRLLSHFTVQETTLLDYIQAREEDLSSR